MNAVPSIECSGPPQEDNGNVTIRWNVLSSGGEEASIMSIRIYIKIDAQNVVNYTLLTMENFTSAAPMFQTVNTGSLLAGLRYIFRVAVENEVGFSEPTDCPSIVLQTGKQVSHSCVSE